MDYKNILYQKRDHLCHITLNRPEVLNALSRQLLNELDDALHKADEDDDVRVIIIKGAGRAFCAGYDISPEEKEEELTLVQYLQQHRVVTDHWHTLWRVMKPVIAQVHGYCLAGATDLALTCDMVIAAEDATFGLPDVRALESVHAHMWTYLAGPQWAKRMMLTGDPIDGKTAEKIGIILEAVPADKLEEAVNTLAGRIANIPTDLLIPNKALVNKAMAIMGHHLMQDLANEAVMITHYSPIVKEFYQMSVDKGLRAALQWRDGPFGDYTAAKKKG